MDDELATACDDLCCLAQGYLRFGQPQRAFVLLMIAMHMCAPSARLLLLCAKCFFALRQADQAQAVLDRHDRSFGPTRASRFYQARARKELQARPSLASHSTDVAQLTEQRV
ncbi:hypothetical protein AIOL_001326 [Candidatus Rhodobacter oscarellae]|uniref:TPR repeat protein n=1 Tax=Candidatus Rhodobacter oscarellae TaxID=1675527 RepID=A0A0J9E3H5_9RHOB|nr:hypothetical protein [Candidatus Rhodobacter lobularis]KMW56374.1 hypothetical protein AIOL_001326 [Candidatus Rhodobacter lobularis]